MNIIALDPIITMSTVGGGGDCVWLVAADQYHNNWDTLKGAANNKLFCPCHSRVRPERRPPTLINSGSFVLPSQRQSSSWSSTSVQSSHQQSYIVLVRETRGLSNNYRPRPPGHPTGHFLKISRKAVVLKAIEMTKWSYLLALWSFLKSHHKDRTRKNLDLQSKNILRILNSLSHIRFFHAVFLLWLVGVIYFSASGMVLSGDSPLVCVV